MIMKRLLVVLVLALFIMAVSVSAASEQPTMGEKNAVKKAIAYLKYSSFSKIGLVKQLEYEGFSSSEANYGVNHIEVDWNEQAVKKAEAYLKYSSFSRKGLIGQLEYEGFTREQAEYGVKSVGY